MTLAVHTATVTKKTANLRVRTAGGTKLAENAYLRTAAGLKSLFSKFAVSVDKPVVYAARNSAGSTPVTTPEVAALVDGATGAAAYTWSRADGGAHPWTIDSPNSATTTFTTSVARASIEAAAFKCTVTDAGGHSADTPNVSAQAENLYGGTL
jgi:hypothetical protein